MIAVIFSDDPNSLMQNSQSQSDDSTQSGSAQQNSDAKISQLNDSSKKDSLELMNFDLEKANQKIQELEDKWKRALADLENFRRKTASDQAQLTQFANENLLIALLPILDNFALAKKHLPQDLVKNDWVNGVLFIEKQITDVLTGLGLTKIPVKVGDAIDPNQHQVISMNGEQSEKIVEILADGFRLHDKIVRPVQVKAGA